MRLLPWSTPDGRPCYLLGSGGYVSRVADNVESVQLAMAQDLLGHAEDMFAAERTTTPHQLRFLAARLAEALRDVHRIAESRGARLPAPD